MNTLQMINVQMIFASYYLQKIYITKDTYTNEIILKIISKSRQKCRLFYFRYSIIEYAASLPERAAHATVPFAPAISPPAKIFGLVVLFFSST